MNRTRAVSCGAKTLVCPKTRPHSPKPAPPPLLAMSAPVPLIEEAALTVGVEIGRGASGLAYKGTLNGVTDVCLKVIKGSASPCPPVPRSPPPLLPSSLYIFFVL